MHRTTKIITIPKPDPGTFDKNRTAGTLLRSQIIHLRHALSKYVHEVTSHLKEATELLAVDPGSIKKEGEVSAYSKKVMAILHPQAAKPSRK
ncbi:MAG: hypothetical protein WBL63_14910 [Candidatus Acidiferrum sp.]